MSVKLTMTEIQTDGRLLIVKFYRWNEKAKSQFCLFTIYPGFAYIAFWKVYECLDELHKEKGWYTCIYMWLFILVCVSVDYMSWLEHAHNWNSFMKENESYPIHIVQYEDMHTVKSWLIWAITLQINSL